MDAFAEGLNTLAGPLCMIYARECDLWEPSVGSSSHNGRNVDLKDWLLRVTGLNQPRCMLTGIESKVIVSRDEKIVGNRVVLAHLIPHRLNAKTKQHKLTLIGMEADDIASIRNYLFLADPIEKAFDRYHLSFEWDGNAYKLRIFNEECRNTPIYKDLDDGHKLADVPVIGGYEGLPLNFYGHDVFKTVLSLHCYQSFLKNGSVGDPPRYNASPERNKTHSLNLAKLHTSGLFNALFDKDEVDEVGLGSDSE